MTRTTLIARDGYGGNYTAAGADDYMLAPGARLYVGPHGRPVESLGGVLDKIGSFVKGAGSGALDFYKQSLENKGAANALQAQQAQQGGGGMPSWVLPVALVAGVGVVALVLLKKPRKNPLYRRSRKGGGQFKWRGKWRYPHPGG